MIWAALQGPGSHGCMLHIPALRAWWSPFIGSPLACRSAAAQYLSC